MDAQGVLPTTDFRFASSSRGAASCDSLPCACARHTTRAGHPGPQAWAEGLGKDPQLWGRLLYLPLSYTVSLIHRF